MTKLNATRCKWFQHELTCHVTGGSKASVKTVSGGIAVETRLTAITAPLGLVRGPVGVWCVGCQRGTSGCVWDTRIVFHCVVKGQPSNWASCQFKLLNIFKDHYCDFILIHRATILCTLIAEIMCICISITNESKSLFMLKC